MPQGILNVPYISQIPLSIVDTRSCDVCSLGLYTRLTVRSMLERTSWNKDNVIIVLIVVLFMVFNLTWTQWLR